MIKLVSYKSQADKSPAMDPWPEINPVESGNPKQSAFTAFTSPDGSFTTGLWSCTPGRFPVTSETHEICHILTGKVRITTKGGAPQEFGPNDVIVMPAGWQGTWEILEPVRKVYALSSKR